MSPEPKISCPHCRAEIKLTESLAAPLIEATRLQYETKLSAQTADFAKRERAVASREASLAAVPAPDASIGLPTLVPDAENRVQGVPNLVQSRGNRVRRNGPHE